MFGLFKQKVGTPDRSQTQFAYRLKYWPYRELSAHERSQLKQSKRCLVDKATLEDRVNHNKTTVFWGDRTYVIVWEHNNTPTETEWLAKAGRGLIMELRSSPVIPEYSVAILSFHRPSFGGI